MIGLFKYNSIRHRFAFGLATVITIVMLSFSSVLIFYNSRSVEKQLNDQLERITAFSKESLSIALWQYNYDYVREYIESLFLYEDIVFASIIVKEKEIGKKIDPNFKEFSFSEFQNSPQFISAEAQITHKKTIVGHVQLVLSRGRIRNLVVATSSISILILMLVNIAVFGTNYLMSNWYLFKPLSKLETSVKVISSGNLDAPIDCDSKDEIGQLANSFEQMIANLKKITTSRDKLNKEIKERKIAEEKIQLSLKEKEVLFKEIHHRVKNNMQIIQSLLSLQSNEIKDPEYKKLLIDSNNRIRSMALIHETLYRSEDIAQLNIRTYFEKIAQHLIAIYHRPELEITLNVDVESIDLNMDLSIACGLIINELVSNALKYAFHTTSKGILSISLTNADANMTRLTICDNGIGLPEDIDLKESKSLGLKIVKILVEGQLKGNISLKNSNGALFEIQFRLP